MSGKRNPTVRDFIYDTGRGQLKNPWVGSPKNIIADRLEEWLTERACNGFVVPTYLPGACEAFMWLVIPKPQWCGVYRKAYAGTTLGAPLGLARPEVGAWRH